MKSTSGSLLRVLIGERMKPLWGCGISSRIRLLLFLIILTGFSGEIMASDSNSVSIVGKLLPAMKICSFNGVKQVEIIYGVLEQKPDREKGAVIIVNGRNETFVKYRDLINEISILGYTVYALDHRGQGFSGRQLEDPQKGHVDTYDDYVADFDFFLKNVVDARPHKVKIILAHSMGGTIVLLHELYFPGSCNGMILSSPMLGFSTAPWPFFLVPPLLSLYEFLGLERNYVVGGGGFKPEIYTPDNNLTSDKANYTANQKLMIDYPQIQLGSPTCAWVKESLTAIKKIMAGAGAGKIEIPLLLLQAEKDRVVDNCAEESFCRKTGKNCQLMVIPGAQHEILLEKPVIREAAKKYIFAFIEHIAKITH